MVTVPAMQVKLDVKVDTAQQLLAGAPPPPEVRMLQILLEGMHIGHRMQSATVTHADAKLWACIARGGAACDTQSNYHGK